MPPVLCETGHQDHCPDVDPCNDRSFLDATSQVFPTPTTKLDLQSQPSRIYEQEPLVGTLLRRRGHEPEIALKSNITPHPTPTPTSNSISESTHTTVSQFEPYASPSVVLRASLILPPIFPLATTTPTRSVQSKVAAAADTQLVSVFAAVVFGFVLIAAAAIVGRIMWKRKHGPKATDVPLFSFAWMRSWKDWDWRGKPLGQQVTSLRKHTRKHTDYDDSTWGTPTGTKERKSKISQSTRGFGTGNILQTQTQTVDVHMTSVSQPPIFKTDNMTPSSLLMKATQALNTIQEDFVERLEPKETDIALSLNTALHYAALSSPMCGVPEQLSTMVLEGGEDFTTILSLQAGMRSAARREYTGGVRNRCRQGSDASQATTVTQVSEGFSSGGSTKSSMTSLASEEFDLDEDDETEDVEDSEIFEVRRGQTKSVEMKMGVLVNCKASDPIMVPPSMPQVVVSDATPTLPIENRGALSTSTSQLGSEDLDLDDEQSLITKDSNQMLRAPIPYLMVTVPSNNSLFALECSNSSASIDLSDFPIPPPPLDKSLASKTSRPSDFSVTILDRKTSTVAQL